jgi:ornithine carbamoyltransferase
MKKVKHFLTIADYSQKEILALLKLAQSLKAKQQKKQKHEYLKNMSLAMIFQKPSNRTRVSFEVGMFQLGGQAINIQPSEINMGKREAVKDVARTLSRYVDIVLIRAIKHEDILEYAKYSSVPVINGLSDLVHPCQAMADVMTIMEHKKDLEKINLSYIGDGDNNVCYSLIEIANLLGIKIKVSSPKGYEPQRKNLKFEFISDPMSAAKNADVIYTDVWISMGQEAETKKRLKDFKSYCITPTIISQAKRDAIFMHCLPAHRGEEVTDEVIESSQSVVFAQAENRLHAQKAIMVHLLGGK